MKRRHWFVGTAAMGLAWSGTSRSQGKPLRIVVPYPPGGSADLLARLIAKPLGDVLGVSTVVDNRPGANGAIGARDAAQSPPDGSTLVIVTDGMYSILPHMLPPGGKDHIRDLAPVTHLMETPLIIAVRPDLGVADLPELVRLAKARPEQLTFAANNTSSTHFIAFETLKKQAGIRVRHIPYSGSGPALLALLGGQVDIMVGTAQMKPQADGKVVYIAVTSRRRYPLLPQVPTVGETYPGFDQPAALGLMTARGTPPEVIARLGSAINKVLHDPANARSLMETGAGVVTGGEAAEFGALIERQRAARADLIKELNIKA
ncbi:Bug family tripartite tricarboxylate transporter substrate binding protein [Aquabacterium sp. J223]|uniref:Bug family tripartite tricarboxylate transporter substrate binding protein n=1 Tax=Aquabacterium sp. J223 TaxID=2898431 RepID=UPI0021AD846E|nr:tripartite tricarboxylate transporter substrate binding protein [Aquabacterium sp. J223]UUX93990.1 tripartite tricarboxylate transporter substrate binding protein [Aquabacterium sp. J223]